MTCFGMIDLKKSRILHQPHNTIQSKSILKKHESRGYLDQHHVFQRILTEIEYFMDEQDVDKVDFVFDNGIRYTLKRTKSVSDEPDNQYFQRVNMHE